MNSRGRASATSGQHRRGHSTGSMAASKAREDNLALFHEMQARERNNFLYPNTDDIEASLSTKFGGISGYRSPRHRGLSDLLGVEHEKNDYDWLLTPPGTPLFPSLDAPPNPAHDTTARISSRTKSARTSPSPKRPISPSVSRRASSPAVSRPATPPGRPSTPGRASTPTRRTLTPSSSFNTSSKSVPTTTGGRTARSSSPSRKPRTVAHPAMPFSTEPPPPNLRTSMPDRPASNPRGATASPRGVNSLKTSHMSDPGDTGGRNKRAISPSFSRSYSSSASSSKGSVISSHNSGIEVNRPTSIKTGADITGKRPISRNEETSPVKPQAKKTLRSPGTTSFSSRKPFENSTRQMDFRRASTSGFRPLMSNSHISTFYTRTASLHRPTQSSVTDSSINSSVASMHDSDDEASSRNMESRMESLAEKADASDGNAGKLVEVEVEMRDREIGYCSELTKAPSEKDSIVQDEAAAPMDMDWSRTPDRVSVQNVGSILESVIDRVLALAEAQRYEACSKDRSVSSGLSCDKDRSGSSGALLSEKDAITGTLDDHPGSSGALDFCAAEKQVVLAEVSNRQEADQLFSLSCSSMEVYQFDQELQTTGSEVDNMVPESPGAANSTASTAVGLEIKDTLYSRPAAKPSRSKVPLRDSSAGFGAKHYMSGRKKESRESSLFSIQMCSSKGESFSSGRLNSIDTQSSMETPRRYPGPEFYTSSNGRYKSEEDAKSEESCVDYYIVEPNKRLNESRVDSVAKSEHMANSFEDVGYVDYYIDEHSSQKRSPKRVAAFTDIGDLLEAEKQPVVAEEGISKPQKPEAEELDAFMDNTPIEVCSMDESSSDSGNQASAQGDDVDMVASWKQDSEDMDCDDEETQPDHTSQFRESTKCSQTLAQFTPPGNAAAYSADSMLFCSSIVHDIMCKAATLGIEKEDLKALGTRASADDLVTFLGLPKTSNTKKWQVPHESSTTVRQTLAYMQNQKVMQNTTVAYMQHNTFGRVQEDVNKDHQFMGSLDVSVPGNEGQAVQRKPKSSKCKCCTIL